MTTTALTHTNLTPRVGSLVETDVADLLSGRHAAELRELLEHRSVVAMRGIEIEDEQQVAIARTLGQLESSVVGEVYKVTFDKKENPIGAATNRATFFWHIDRTDLDVPPFASILSAKVLTPSGGQTEFVNTYAAYDDLPADDKDRLDRLKVLHCLETAFRETFPDPTERQLAAWRQMPKKIHPLVWHHRSGRNSLVLSNSATAVIGMDEEESRELLARLLAWATQPQFVYTHEWEIDDLVIWNNTGAMHRVREYDEDYGRRLHRTTLLGDEPFDSRRDDVPRVIDKIEIQETISLYHEGGSKADWDQVMATFLPDGIWEVPGLDIRCQGHADIRRAMSAMLAPMEYLVQINAPAIIVVDGDAATARSLVRECAKLRDRAGLIDVVGQFRDELQRTPLGWRFARRRFTILGTHLSAEAGRAPAHEPAAIDEVDLVPRFGVGDHRERAERKMTEVTGKAAVVTGGGSGIGMGLAKELAHQGASVAVADIMPDNARKVAGEINDAGGTAIAIECDVCERSSIEQLKAEANAALGTIQLVFANAGATSFLPVLDLTESEIDWMTQVNLKGVIWTALTFLPDLIEAGGGHVVATASMAGLIPTLVPVHTAYAAAKMGVIGFVRSMQLEVEEHDVHCTLYCPGGVLNSMRDNNAKYRPERFGGPSDERMQIPHASFKDNRLRFYTPEDVAPMVLRAVRDNRPFVFDHSEQRASFRELYSGIIEACFDDTEQWEDQAESPTPAS